MKLCSFEESWIVETVAQIGRDGSVSGKLGDRTSGERGGFWGALDKDQLLGGRFNLGARGGDWSAPGFVMPVDALPTSDEIAIAPPE